MFIFYNPKEKTVIKLPLKKTACQGFSSALKPKSKCCKKYKKKGVNCKRCPLTYQLKKVS